MDEKVSRAMAAAKRLEDHKVSPMGELERVYRDGMEQAEDLRELLKPAWFVNVPRRKVYKPGHVTKSRR